MRGYVEETLARVGPFEVTVGIDLRYPEMQGTPYTALIYEGERWWVAVEAAKPVPGDLAAFRLAIMGGMSW